MNKIKSKMTMRLAVLLLAFSMLLLPVAAAALVVGGETAVVYTDFPAPGHCDDDMDETCDDPHVEPDCNAGNCPVGA